MNNHVTIDPNEATQLLKDILKVGKPQPSTTTGAESSSVTNGTVEMASSSHKESFNSAAGENLLDSLFNPSQKQNIYLSGSEEEISVAVYGEEVHIYAGPLHQGASSSKVKIDNIVDYGWEQKYHTGRLVCLHLSGKYLAYAIRTAVAQSGAIRILNNKTGERTLIKGLKGLIKDISFAHISTQIVLAVTDEYGTLYVYEITEEANKLYYNLLVQVDRPADTQSSDNHRVIWCPYIPDESCSMDEMAEVEDVSKLLVVTNKEEAEMWNIDIVVKEYGRGPITPDQVKIGMQKIAEHSLPITDAAFAPDGSALATASADGTVKFFQVHIQEMGTSPRCLHRWEPHKGKPLSSVFFLDNHKSYNPDVQFWKFAVTGADNNRELKLWSCESWACLQTIRFMIPSGDTTEPLLKAEIDLSSNYILLSDINRKVLYILFVYQEPSTSHARVTSIAYFPLTLPVLSFAVADASRCKFKPSIDTEQVEKIESEDQEHDQEDYIPGREKCLIGTTVKLFWVNTKSLQACRIVYQPVTSVSGNSSSTISTLSQDSFVHPDHLSDFSLDIQEFEVKKEPFHPDQLSDLSLDTLDVEAKKEPFIDHLNDFNPLETSDHKIKPLPSGYMGNEVLLTPNDFTSPTHSSGVTMATTSVQTPPSASRLSPINSSNLSSGGKTVISSVSGSVHTPSTPSLVSSGTSPHLSNLVCSHGVVTPPSLPLPPVTPTEEKVLTTSVNSEDRSETPLAPSEDNVNVQRKLSQRSSASSPSQEVAEILAPAKLLGNESRSDEEDDEEDGTEGYDYQNVDDKLSKTSPITDKENANDYLSTGDWPKPPDTSVPYPVISPGTELHEDTSPLHAPKDPSHIADHSYQFRESQNYIDEHTNQLNAIMQLLQAQSQQLQEIEANQRSFHRLTERMDGIERVLSTQLEAVGRHSQTELSRMESLLTRRETLDKEVASGVSQAVTSFLGSRLDKALKNEFKNSVIPNVSRTMETIREQLQQEANRTLSSTEVSVRDGVGKLIKSKVLIDSVTSAISSTVQTHVQATCREVFQSTVVPTIDRVCQNLFLQINDAFQRGTREYLHQVEGYVDKQQAEEHLKKQFLFLEQNLQTSIRSLQESLNQQLQPVLSLKDVQKHTDQSIQDVKESLLQVIQQNLTRQEEMMHTVLREEFRAVLQEQHHFSLVDGALVSARSRTVTPVPQADPHLLQQQISQQIRQGQYNTAFQQALSASDLSLVLAACEQITPSQLFSQQQCPLLQPVILSLIHQLSADLSSHTELKLRYLEEAVVSLDSANPVTREHIGTIMAGLCQKLTFFIECNPTHRLNRNMKRLLMATKSLVS